MNLFKKILTIIGAITLFFGLIVLFKYGSGIAKMDSKALGLYMEMADTVLKTGDPAKAMVMKKKLVIEEGTSKEEAIQNAIEIMDEVGEEYGLAKVDEKTMPRGGKFMKDGGKYTHIRSYCSPTIADKFLNYSGEYIGFMPCRIGIVEDNGDIWIYTMKLDMMIHGGYPLPEELLKYAEDVKKAMELMVEKGASGEI
jgi:hypothetical protein